MTTKVFSKLPMEAKLVREEVFIYEQGFSYDYDEIDDTAVHIVGFEADEPIAACRVFESEEQGTFVLGRLAVKKDWRGSGNGTKMVEAAKNYIKCAGGKRLILHSQLHAAEFYEKIGFSAYGEVEYEENCPHIWMRAEL